MTVRRKSRKRPCRICRKWFYPNPRAGERQKTCGSKNCQETWHAKKCGEWNKKNRSYFREIYLSKKLSAVGVSTETDDLSCQANTIAKSTLPVPPFSKSSQLPRNLIQEVIGAQHLVIIEYTTQLLVKSFQEVMLSQVAKIKREFKQLPHNGILRGDSVQRGP